MKSALSVQVYHPTGALATWVQGVWSASVACTNENRIDKLLHSDACSGLIFILKGEVKAGNRRLTEGGYFLPNSRQAGHISMLPGAQLAGVRLYPAAGYAFWQKNFECPTPITSLPDKSATLIELNRTLLKSTGHFAKIRVLYLFLKNYVKSVADMPDGLTMALLQLRTQAGLQHSAINANVGQRQLERQFQRWLAMTPKQCQRVFRVARALTSIRNNLEESLASIAFESGFSDQAHMTREFKQIAKISPQAYRIQQIEKQSVVV